MYQLTQNPNIIRKGGAFIPADPLNRDYADYLAWVAEGNTPDPYVAPPASLPQSVTRFQAKAALLQAGLLTSVEAMMSDPATSAIAKLAWVEALEFRRDSPTVLAMAASLGLSNQQIDDLFFTASTITA